MSSSSSPVAVVTGGARGLGRHLSESLSARGYSVAILYHRSAETARSLAQQISEKGGRARALQVDVAVESQVANAFAEIAGAEGKVDLLINNVGIYNTKHVFQLEPATWDATLATNLSGAYYCCYHALRLMKHGGGIINIGAAGLGTSRADVHGMDYFISKTGLLSLTRALAVAYGPQKIRVNMVSPGHLETSVDLPPPGEIQRAIPLGRAAQFEDVARAVDYLIDANFVTGVNLDVAGGFRL